MENSSGWESIQTLFRITRLAHGKSYLVIIGPNAHENLLKVALGQVGVRSYIA